jgi:hypothetical protein
MPLRIAVERTIRKLYGTVAIRNCYNQVVVGDEHQRAKPEAVPEEGQNIEI